MTDKIEEIKKKINDDTVKIISFDLFDTLVIRPSFSSRTILKMFTDIEKRRYGIDFYEERLRVEKENVVASIDEIWRVIASLHGLSEGEEIAKREFEFEKALLMRRAIGKALYDEAVSAGKKIIVVSDMYFSSRQIREILDITGYYTVSDIYVSSECGETKRSGKLYDIVLQKENVMPEEIFHIGDSSRADYEKALEKGIGAACLCKDSKLFVSEYVGCYVPSENNAYEDLILGFSIHSSCENYYDNFSLQKYAQLVIFPMLMHSVLFLSNNADIQKGKKYNCLFFTSRDGYLTKKAYDIMRKYRNDILISQYLRTSRAACRVLVEEEFLDRCKARWISNDATMERFVSEEVKDESLNKIIINRLNPDELSCKITYNTGVGLLQPFVEDLNLYHKKKKEAARAYYDKYFSKEKSVLLIDCGFSGTIPAYLTRAYNGKKKFDKVYCWENDKNELLDDIDGSTTFYIFNEKRGHLVGTHLETFFSERIGSCTGFYIDGEGNIMSEFDETPIPDEIYADIALVQQLSLELVDKFCRKFAKILHLIIPDSITGIFEILKYLFSDERKENAVIFRNIRFREPYTSGLSAFTFEDKIKNYKRDR